ncbi:MAG TPA: PPC domain-containing DNA-binding protein [Candidatus Latescibacteria bacterium]|nr:PPC domain-containing DNA-binding protein [Candidatus Latescibacterota bacterium]
MKYFVSGSRYIIRLDAGEKIVASLLSLCERDGIGSGFFNGLGAVGEAELGHFNPATGDYSWTQFSGPYEIVSLYGNITRVEGKPFLHAHASLGDKTFAVRGGHLREAVVSVTCEVTLTRFKDDIGRKKDAATGLFLLDPKSDEG